MKKLKNINARIDEFMKQEVVAINPFSSNIDTACTGISCACANDCERYHLRHTLSDWMSGRPHTVGGGPSKKCFAFVNANHKPLQKPVSAED